MKATQPAARCPEHEPIGDDAPRITEAIPENTQDELHDIPDHVSTRTARLLAAYQYTALSH